MSTTIPRIALVSSWDAGVDGLGAVTWPNKEEYCRLRGYAAVKLPPIVPGYWAKLAALRHTLHRFDWGFLIDADTLITNMTVRLEDIIAGLKPGVELAFTSDSNGINMGVSLWRNADWARNFMNRVWDRPGDCWHWPHEQAVISHLIFKEPKEKWDTLPQRVMNSYRYGEYGMHCPEGEWQPGDFVLHLPAVQIPKRISIFQSLLPEVVK